MISDTPGRGGRGVKKGQIFADVLYGWPLRTIVKEGTRVKLYCAGSQIFDIKTGSKVVTCNTYLYQDFQCESVPDYALPQVD